MAEQLAPLPATQVAQVRATPDIQLVQKSDFSCSPVSRGTPQALQLHCIDGYNLK